MSNKVVYITGCLGFIGAYVTKAALEEGWRVYGIDKQTRVSHPDLLKQFNEYPNFTYENIDICDLDHLYDCDYVINLAAESHVDNSIVSSDSFMHSNVMGVKNLLELVRHKSDNCEKPIFFQISTDEVYGDIEEGFHTESDILKPSNPYSASKASADMMVQAWARTYGIDYLILRPTNNFGIGQYPEKLVPLSVRLLNRGKKIRLHNNGTPIRTWLHADDTARAIIHLIKTGSRNQIYNVSGGYEQANLEVVEKVLKYYGAGSIDEHVDFSYSRQGQDVRYALDDSRLRHTGWSPLRRFDDEIEEIVEYYKNRFIW